MTAQLSWHVQKIIAVLWLEMEPHTYKETIFQSHLNNEQTLVFRSTVSMVCCVPLCYDLMSLADGIFCRDLMKGVGMGVIFAVNIPCNMIACPTNMAIT